MPSYFFLVWVILIGAMFYFMMIKPQKRARAQQTDLMQHLAPGAEVRTNAHILGTVTEVGDDWAIIETTPGTKIKIGKPAIVAIILPDAPEDAEDEAESAEDQSSVVEALAEAGPQDDSPAAEGAVQDAVVAETQDAVPAETADAAQAEPAESASKS